MEKRIFKYTIEREAFPQIEMPQGAEILCVQTQNGTPCIWALVEPNAPVIKRSFEILATGQIVNETVSRKYIGTFQLDGGRLVFHCFEMM